MGKKHKPKKHKHRGSDAEYEGIQTSYTEMSHVFAIRCFKEITLAERKN